MATKRQLKKFIRNTCGDLAVEMMLAHEAFPTIDPKKVYEIVGQAATLQTETLSRISVNFDKIPRDFAEKNEYNRARKAYYRKVFAKLAENFGASVAEIVKKMNATLPDDVRELLKEAAAE